MGRLCLQHHAEPGRPAHARPDRPHLCAVRTQRQLPQRPACRHGAPALAPCLPGEIATRPPAAVYGAPGLACGQILASANPDAKFDYRSTGRDSFFNFDYTEAAWTNTLKLGGITLTSISSYYQHDNDAKIQLIPTPNVGFGGSGILPTRNLESYEQYSQELRLQSDAGNTVDWMAGGYYAHGQLEARNRPASTSCPSP